MKKHLLLLVMILASLGSFAQLQLTVSGMVSLDFPQGPPVPGQLVTVQLGADSAATVSYVTFTNEAGHYTLTLEPNIPQGILWISTFACDDSIVFVHPFNAGNNNIVQDFVLCQNGGGDCQAFFDYQLLEGFGVAFTNLSQGGELSFEWQFGDGSSSTEPNPVHTYAQQGVYDVCLTVVSADSSCLDAMCQPVMVGGDVPPACLAMFDFVLTGDLTVDFINLSEGAGLMSIWAFGDGEASTATNPVHTYAETGNYEVTLTIFDTLLACQSTTSAMLILGDSASCFADFSYNIDPNTPLQVSFMELSSGNASSFIWDFGDNTMAFEPNPVHTFAQQGVYNVCLTVMSADSSCYDVICLPVAVGGDQPGCQAMFTHFPVPENDTIYPSPLTLQFWDTSIGNPISWSWDFGDGYTSSEQNPAYTFGSPGVYNVCLTIQTSGETTCISTYCEPVVISGDSAFCVAQFVYYPDSSNNSLNRQFVDLSYGSNNISSWYWDFGDGASSTEQNPVHTFAQTGFYQVCLTIAGDNCQSTWCEEVFVGNEVPCFNYFTYESAGNTVLFNGFHSTDIPASYMWEFGDGSTAYGVQVTHSYEGPGMYYVNLFTYDDNQCSAVSSQMVVVGDSIVYRQLYGQVFEGNLPMTQGFVLLFSVDTVGNYMPFFDVAVTDASGIYVFPYVPQGNFLLYAINLDFEGYMPTYYGDVINWEEATVISLGEPDNPYNINLVQTAAAMAWGNNNINGFISNNAVRDGFMDKIKVLLYSENNESLGYTEVGADGSFSFENLAAGVYYLDPELSGVSAQPVRVDLSGENTTAQVNMTFNGNSITGINTPDLRFETGTLYPNPVINTLHLSIQATAESQLTWQIVGVEGRVWVTDKMLLNHRSNELRIDVNQLPQGLYILQLTDSNQQQSYRRFIK